MTSYYRGNFQGIGRMLQQPGIRLACIRAAADMLPTAVNISPTGDPSTDPHPGLYQRSFRVEYGEKPVKFHGVNRPRPYGRLVNTANYAVDVEHGTDRVPRHAVLRRTLDAAVAAHRASS
jgi:hypothetical protein